MKYWESPSRAKFLKDTIKHRQLSFTTLSPALDIINGRALQKRVC